MKKSDENLPVSTSVARVPAFAVTPPVRCFSQVGSTPGLKCGELATVKRPGNRWFSDSFHCGKHAEPTDVPIGGDYVIRRCRVTCDVLLAGVDEREGIAKAEAVARLTAAVAAAGGVLDVKMVTSQTGRYPAARPAGATSATPGRAE